LEELAVSREPLDPADAHEPLARYIAQLARRALLTVAGDNQTAVEAQVRLASSLSSELHARVKSQAARASGA
jgi:hypothetical protein